jgi:hypothetical protein
MTIVLKALGQEYIQKLVTLLIIDIIFYTSSDAQNVSSLILMIGFILVLISTYYICRAILGTIALYGIKFKRPTYLSFYASIVLGSLLALQSVGELSPHDIVVLLPIGILAYLYSSYGSSPKRSSTDS